MEKYTETELKVLEKAFEDMMCVQDVDDAAEAYDTTPDVIDTLYQKITGGSIDDAGFLEPRHNDIEADRYHELLMEEEAEKESYPGEPEPNEFDLMGPEDTNPHNGEE